MPKSTRNATSGSSNLSATLWAAADALRNNMDAAEYKHVVLGLIFLKYISDAFEAKHTELEAQRAQGADPEDPDEYRAVNIFWVPKEARWPHLKANAPQPTIGKLDEIRKHGHVLTPGRYVGAEAVEDDGEPFDEKMKRLTATLREQQAEAAKLDEAIAANLKGLGYGG